MTSPSSVELGRQPGLLEGVDDRPGRRGLAVAQPALGEAAEVGGRLLVVGVGRREEPRQHRVLGDRGGAGELRHQRLEGVRRRRRRLGALVAQQLDDLRGQRPQQVGLEAGEGGDDPAGLPVVLETAHPQVAFSIVAQRPYSCIAWTSRSISSRVPVETTDRPSVCTSSISFSDFALS